MLMQKTVGKAVAIVALREAGLIPGNLPDGDPLTEVILVENYEPVRSEDGSTGWVKYPVPFTPTAGEIAIREFYAQIRVKTVSFNRALKLINRCFKKVGVYLDFKQIYDSKNVQHRIRLVQLFFARCEDNEYEVLPSFALRFKPSMIDGLPLVQNH